jgi:L-2-hydroxyglutarate oxidase LhgO
MHIKKNGRIKLPISNKYFKSYKKIAVIGAGWFGCHIAYQLIKKNYSVKIYEERNDIFCGASGNNQNRLHLGFHYPRSLITRT